MIDRDTEYAALAAYLEQRGVEYDPQVLRDVIAGHDATARELIAAVERAAVAEIWRQFFAACREQG